MRETWSCERRKHGAIYPRSNPFSDSISLHPRRSDRAPQEKWQRSRENGVEMINFDQVTNTSSRRISHVLVFHRCDFQRPIHRNFSLDLLILSDFLTSTICSYFIYLNTPYWVFDRFDRLATCNQYSTTTPPSLGWVTGLL